MCDDCSCRTVAKVILVIVNVLLLLIGLLMLGLGIALAVSPDGVIKLFVEKLNVNELEALAGEGVILESIKAFGIFLLILGIIVALVSLFGFAGACCEVRWLLMVYAIILILMVLAEIALIIFAAVDPQKFQSSYTDAISKSLNGEFADYSANANGTLSLKDGGPHSASWHGIQQVLQCCGVNNYTDYQKIDGWRKFNCEKGVANCGTEYKVPITCCKKKAEKTAENVNDFINYEQCLKADQQYLNENGCVKLVSDKITGFVKENSYVAIGICVAVIALEVILIILAICLFAMRGDSSKYV